MNLPGFNAEASLAPSKSIYRNSALFGGSRENKVLPTAPCCSSEDKKALKVTYSHTKCGPLRDFIVAPISDTATRSWGAGWVQPGIGSRLGTADWLAHQGNRFSSYLDQIVCMTSKGPWDATLTETRACSGYGPVHTLIINAFGEQVQFNWQGGVEMHPPGIGLVSCRQIHNIRSRCSPHSTCDCLSFFCPPTQSCECSLENQW